MSSIFRVAETPLFEWTDEGEVHVGNGRYFLWTADSFAPCYMYLCSDAPNRLGHPAYRGEVALGMDGLEFLT